jgi:hypothetical protein
LALPRRWLRGDRDMRVIKDTITPKECPAEVPADLLLPHQAQAIKNHGQTLEELEARGGASIREIYAILSDIRYDFFISEREATEIVLRLMDDASHAS